MSAHWPSRIVWALVLASALSWGYALSRPDARADTATPAGPLATDDAAALARLLGAEPPPPPPAPEEAPPATDPRLQLVGVVSAPTDAEADEGLALIAIDGGTAKVFRVGMVVDGDTVLQAVEARGVRLGPAGGATVLALTVAAPPAGSGSNPVTSFGASPPPSSFAPAVVPPMVNRAPVADGSPPPFGGPPPAVGGTPAAQAYAPQRRLPSLPLRRSTPPEQAMVDASTPPVSDPSQ